MVLAKKVEKNISLLLEAIAATARQIEMRLSCDQQNTFSFRIIALLLDSLDTSFSNDPLSPKGEVSTSRRSAAFFHFISLRKTSLDDRDPTATYIVQWANIFEILYNGFQHFSININ